MLLALPVRTFEMKNIFGAASSRWQAQPVEFCPRRSCFSQGKLRVLLAMCASAHERKVALLNGKLCQSFVSSLGAEAVELLWTLFVLRGIIAIFIFNEWLPRARISIS